jgi:hypothetical protein
MSSQSTKERNEYLKEARKKYYFNDPSVPSFRLLECHDDNGKFIEEKELWRPLNWSSQDENKVYSLVFLLP